MSMLRDENEVALDEVAETCRAAAEHYRTAGAVAHTSVLADLFRRLEENRRRGAAALEDEIRRMGNLPGAPDPDREALEHLATRLKAAVAADERRALLASCLQMEEKLAAAVDAALDQNLPAPTHALLRRLQTEGSAIREDLTVAD